MDKPKNNTNGTNRINSIYTTDTIIEKVGKDNVKWYEWIEEWPVYVPGANHNRASYLQVKRKMPIPVCK